jgi:hypothetical protein
MPGGLADRLEPFAYRSDCVFALNRCRDVNGARSTKSVRHRARHRGRSWRCSSRSKSKRLRFGETDSAQLPRFDRICMIQGGGGRTCQPFEVVQLFFIQWRIVDAIHVYRDASEFAAQKQRNGHGPRRDLSAAEALLRGGGI